MIMMMYGEISRDERIINANVLLLLFINVPVAIFAEVVECRSVGPTARLSDCRFDPFSAITRQNNSLIKKLPENENAL